MTGHPIVVITVRGGLVEYVHANVPVTAFVEDWDCPPDRPLVMDLDAEPLLPEQVQRIRAGEEDEATGRPIRPEASMTVSNQERAIRCQQAMTAYSDDDAYTNLVDFLADAMHFCHVQRAQLQRRPRYGPDAFRCRDERRRHPARLQPQPTHRRKERP